MWCVGELGLPYRRHDIGHRFDGNDTTEFLAMNPHGLVPVLRDDDGEPLWETGAILRYLAARYGSDPFWPEDATARAHVDKWAEWAKIEVTSRFTVPIFWRVTRVPPSKRDWDAIGNAVAEFDKVLDIAEVQLAGRDFLAANDFTLADIQFGHVLYRYFDIPIVRPRRPNLQRYYDALTTRPAYREHVMVSYEELQVRD